MRCDFIKFTDTSTDTDPVSLQFGRKCMAFRLYISVDGTFISHTYYIPDNLYAVWRYQGWSFVAQSGGAYIFESCNYYPEGQEIDATWKTAQAFAIMSFIFGFFLMIGSCVFACAQDNTNVSTRGWLAPFYLLLTLFQGLSLLFMNSNACNSNVQVKYQTETTYAEFPETCSLNTGANLIISATVLWFAAAVSSFGAARMAKTDQGGEDAQADLDAELADKVEAAKVDNEEEAAKGAESGIAQ